MHLTAAMVPPVAEPEGRRYPPLIMRIFVFASVAASVLFSSLALAQEPVAWGSGRDITFHTFSIVAIDPRTGETGVIVTTRNPCVGNAVPWVRVGVGAVATQGGTRRRRGPREPAGGGDRHAGAQRAVDR
jgi:Family of unknown function (DUF1028)